MLLHPTFSDDELEASYIETVPCRGGLLAAVTDPSSDSSVVYASLNARAWSGSQQSDSVIWQDDYARYGWYDARVEYTEQGPPGDHGNYSRSLAGGVAGAAVVLGSYDGEQASFAQTRLQVTRDCHTWTNVDLPQFESYGVPPVGITILRGGFLAYGALTVDTPEGVTWWSADGSSWNESRMPFAPAAIWTGADGAVAMEEPVGAPKGSRRWATSPDGSTWHVVAASSGFVPNLGQVASDGNHIVVVGSRSGEPPFRMWSSTNGTDWQSIAMASAPPGLGGVAGRQDLDVLPDGVIAFAPDGGAWFGRATATRVPKPTPWAPSTPQPSPTEPPGTVPPISTATWTGLTIRPISGGPVGATSIATWTRGYLAMRAAQLPRAAAVWVSHNGLAWEHLPTDTFGSVRSVMAAQCRNQVLVAVTRPSGTSAVYRSGDGLRWRRVTGAPRVLAQRGHIAGDERGAIIAATDGAFYLTRDCTTWTGIHRAAEGRGINEVAAANGEYVAIECETSSIGRPPGITWWSTNLDRWHSVRNGECVYDTAPGAHGWMGVHWPVGVPSTTQAARSLDGRHWRYIDDPLGNWSGEGLGAMGTYAGDGIRILGYALETPYGAPSVRYVTSADGVHWTRLRLKGRVGRAETGFVTVLLLRNGVLFVGDLQTWFGAAMAK